MEERSFDLAVIGGGPAGSAAAITAARSGACVLLLERGRFPRHKVCGEFISPESLRLLQALLDGDAVLTGAPRIERARLYWGDTLLQAEVSPAAASVSRYDLDHALWSAAEGAGAECRQGTAVEQVSPGECGFRITVANAPEKALQSKAVIDATGRWSNLRTSRQLPADTWVGLKAHFAGEECTSSVDLYFFPEGYCGVQPLGGGRVNACAMVRASAKFGNSVGRVFAAHPELLRRSRQWTPVTETAATAPLFFRSPQPVLGNVLLAGDAAGFIDPFVGDGISLALRSGTLAAACLIEKRWSAAETAKLYQSEYQKQFSPVFRHAAQVRRMLALPRPVRGAVAALARVPGVTEYVLRSTRLK
jgi:flavin-dependent dehydrogenase